MALRILKRKGRTAGTRAGIDRAKILEAAILLWLSGGPESCSIRAVAKRLEVVPTTVHAHFKGGVAELRDELARFALTQRTPPYKPAQDPKNYLRQLFRSLLAECRQKPHLGSLIVLGLSKEPLFCPVFAERLCATIAEIAKKQPLPGALRLAVSRLIGLIVVETSEWTFVRPEAAKERIIKRTSALPGAEFPNLNLLGEKLVADARVRSATGYAEKIAYATADALIAELSKGAK